jgi:acetoin:2,6-dichlorophenolindophenol oxidoreductase subunit beta
MSTLADPRVAPSQVERELTYREAVNLALDEALARDPSVVFMGEDIASDGGVFKTNAGLIDRYGPDRVMNTPISENGFTGVALGMAVMGMRPIVEFMFADFLPSAGDAIVNQLPKYRFMSGGQCSVPVTLRAISGGTGRFGTQHSATGESWFMGLPGLRVCAAGSPSAAYELLSAAIRDSNPTIVHEHKGLYSKKGLVHVGRVAEIGKASIERPGSDVTIVATLLMLDRALQASEQLADEGISAEVIDLRWLHPLDTATVRTSVERTGRLLVVEEQVHPGGWGAAVISELAQQGVTYRRPPKALSLPIDQPIPYSPDLEDALIPSVAAIARSARTLVGAD